LLTYGFTVARCSCENCATADVYNSRNRKITSKSIGRGMLEAHFTLVFAEAVRYLRLTPYRLSPMAVVLRRDAIRHQPREAAIR
jgi:hypothetical protein